VGDDDIALYADKSRSTPVLTWYGLRQQAAREQEDDGSFRPDRCLADFVAPTEIAISNGATIPYDTRAVGKNSFKDYMGVFAVTTGLGIDKKETQLIAAHDDYNAILLKALADRLAKAFAECLHH